jgi:hypothetical protein
MNKYLPILVVALVAIVIIIVLLVLWTSPPEAELTPTTDPNAVYTAAAQTADTRLTQLAAVTPSETPLPPLPTVDGTQTAAAQTVQAQLTIVTGATSTVSTSTTPTVLSTSMPTGSTADRAAYVADVTVPDGTDFNPGASFTKTWRLRNTGSTNWSTSYSLVFIGGDKMGDTTSAAVPVAVAAGAEVDISVALVAPTTPGHYRGYWKMINASGQYFDESIYVEIDVVGTGTQPSGATSTPSSGATATPTSGAPGQVITDLAFAVGESSYTGPCPHTLIFTASFTVLQNTSLTYQLEGGSNTPGFEFDLPSPFTSNFTPGTYSQGFQLDISDSVDGWMRFHITDPVNLTSNQVNFNLTCQ